MTNKDPGHVPDFGPKLPRPSRIFKPGDPVCNDLEQKLEYPSNPLNRPAGFPAKAAIGVGFGYAVLLGVPFILTFSILLSYFGGADFFLSGNSLIIRATLFPVVILSGFFFQSGYLYAVKIFRWVSYLLILNYFLTFFYFALVYFNVVSYETAVGSIGPDWSFYLSFALLPSPFLLIWTIRNVRWFDPSSQPDEWEPPARASSD